MNLRAIVPVLVAGLLVVPVMAAAQVLQVMPVFEARCAQCHGGNAAALRAPDRTMLAQMTPEHILEALTTGSMVANAKGISDGQKRSLAELISGRPIGSSASGQAAAMKGRCEAKPAFNPAGEQGSHPPLVRPSFRRALSLYNGASGSAARNHTHV